jgi:transcriptional regulator with XRE-family HTH domain
MKNKGAKQSYFEIGERLENVRAKVRQPTVSAFHGRLREGWTRGISLRTASNYHRGKREASLAYLSRVVKVFGVRPAYLLLGEEPVFASEEAHWELEVEAAAARDEREENQMEEVWAALPEIRGQPLQVRHFFLEVWSSFNNTGWYHAGVRDYLHADVAYRVRDLLMTPFSPRRPDVSTNQFANYATAMLLALNLAVDVPFSPSKEK